MIRDSLFSKLVGIEEITDLSLNIPGKLMNSIPCCVAATHYHTKAWQTLIPKRMKQ